MNYASSNAQRRVQKCHSDAMSWLMVAKHHTRTGNGEGRAHSLRAAANFAELWARAIRECIDQPPKTRKAKQA